VNAFDPHCIEAALRLADEIEAVGARLEAMGIHSTTSRGRAALIRSLVHAVQACREKSSQRQQALLGVGPLIRRGC
jgi:hypothetical protein